MNNGTGRRKVQRRPRVLKRSWQDHCEWQRHISSTSGRETRIMIGLATGYVVDQPCRNLSTSRSTCTVAVVNPASSWRCSPRHQPRPDRLRCIPQSPSWSQAIVTRDAREVERKKVGLHLGTPRQAVLQALLHVPADAALGIHCKVLLRVKRIEKTARRVFSLMVRSFLFWERLPRPARWRALCAFACFCRRLTISAPGGPSAAPCPGSFRWLVLAVVMGFLRRRSVGPSSCKSICGDRYVSRDEVVIEGRSAACAKLGSQERQTVALTAESFMATERAPKA